MIQEKKRVLGRGLESLIPAARPVTPTAVPGAAEPASGEAVHEIRVEEIEPSPYQPRRRQEEAALEELTQSIRAQGVLQPVVVRSLASAGGNGAADVAALDASAQPKIKFQLIAGERRWLASKKAGRETVPAIIRHVSNEQAVEIALIENVQREDLDCMELAFAFDRLGREFGLTQEEMSKRTGKGRETIGNLLRLLKLPPEVRTALARHELSFGHAKELMGIEDATFMVLAMNKVKKENLSVRQTEYLVNHMIWLASGFKPKPEKPPEDPNVKAARLNLEGKLGCRVKVFDKNGRGRLVIEYTCLEDFDRIVEALGR